jgi:hypothetical protein
MTCTPGSEAHGITADHGEVGVRHELLAFYARDERL